MGVKIRNQNGRLFLDIYYQGKRHWKSLGLRLGPDKELNKESLRTAETIRQQTELQYICLAFPRFYRHFTS